jgi:tetratricopeptide (TPR) repeat protein
MLDGQVTDARTREWVEPALRQLLGLGELEGADRGRLYSAWRMFFEHLAERGTVVLVFEDMQWADEALLDFVEYLLEWSRGHRLFVLALARPELNARRPGWAANRGLTALPLEPLADEAMRALVAGMVPGLPAEVVAQIAARADGTPLYAVETVRMLLDRGLLRQAGEAYEPTGPLEDLDVPESLQALVAARLDALSAPERGLVQTAAVLGKSFTAAGLTAISGQPADEVAGLLDELTRKDIVQVLTDPFSAERGQYTFVQSTLRAVAYERISHRDRKPLHVATADYLAGVEESTDLSEVIAAHLVDAVRLAPDDPDAEALRERARGRLLAAADRASSLGAPDEALRLVQRALELADDPQRARLLEQAGVLAIASERMAEAEELFQQALGLLEAAGEAHAAARVRCRLGDALFLAGRGDEGVPLLDQAYAELSGHPPDEDLALLAAQVARIRMLSGQPPEASLPALDRALEIAEALELPAVTSDTLNTKGLVLLGTPGRQEEGRSLLWGALRVAQEAGSNPALLRARFNLAFDCACEDDLQGDEALNREGLELARRLGDRQWESSFLLHLSSVTFETLAWDEIVGMAEALGERGATSSFAGAVVCALAVVKAYRGQLDEAERLFGTSLVTPEAGDPQTRATWSVWRSYLEQARDDDRATLAAAVVGSALADVIGRRHALAKPPAVLEAVAAARLGDAAAPRFLQLVESLPTVQRRPLYVAGAHRVRALLGEHPEREFAAAEAVYTASGHRWQLAETLRDHGYWLLRADRASEADPVVERALALYDEAGATVRAAELRGLDAAAMAGAAGTG